MWENKDKTTSEFIRIVTLDVELDYRLGLILGLFALDPPPMQGDYAHHDVLL
jgi:hypothetical protein